MSSQSEMYKIWKVSNHQPNKLKEKTKTKTYLYITMYKNKWT